MITGILAIAYNSGTGLWSGVGNYSWPGAPGIGCPNPAVVPITWTFGMQGGICTLGLSWPVYLTGGGQACPTTAALGTTTRGWSYGNFHRTITCSPFNVTWTNAGDGPVGGDPDVLCQCGFFNGWTVTP